MILISCVGSCCKITAEVWSRLMWSTGFLWNCRSVWTCSHLFNCWQLVGDKSRPTSFYLLRMNVYQNGIFSECTRLNFCTAITQTSIRSTTDSTQHGELPRTENDGGNSWKRLCSSLGLARDDDDDDDDDDCNLMTL